MRYQPVDAAHESDTGMTGLNKEFEKISHFAVHNILKLYNI